MSTDPETTEEPKAEPAATTDEPKELGDDDLEQVAGGSAGGSVG